MEGALQKQGQCVPCQRKGLLSRKYRLPHVHHHGEECSEDALCSPRESFEMLLGANHLDEVPLVQEWFSDRPSLCNSRLHDMTIERRQGDALRPFR